MDLHILHKVGLKEKMDDIKVLSICDEKEDIETSIIMFIVKLLISLFAGYLSWTSSINYPIFMRGIFAFFAFMFSGLYILFFLIFRSDIYDFKKLKLDVSKLK